MSEVKFKRIRSWSNVIPKWLGEKAAKKYLPIGENLRKWLWYNNNSNSRLYFIFKHNVKIGLIQIEKNENYYDIAIMVERRFRNNHLATKSLKKLRHIFCDATFRMSVQQCNVPMRKILENLHYVAGHPDEVGLIIYSLK